MTRRRRASWRRRFGAYLGVSAALITAVVVAAGIVVGTFFERRMLAQEETYTVASVQHQAIQHLAPSDFELATASDQAFRIMLSDLPGVFRVKAFDRHGTIVWSNEPKLIGRQFPDHRYIGRALAGAVTMVLEQPRRAEHVYETTRDYVAEAYVPVVLPGSTRPTGVVETYRDMTAAMADLHAVRRRVWTFTGFGGLLLWASLATVVSAAARHEVRAIRQMEKQNLELAAVQDFTRAMLGSLELDHVASQVVSSAGAGLGFARTALWTAAADGPAKLVAAWPADTDPIVPAPEPGSSVEAPGRDGEIAVRIATGNGGGYVFCGELREARHAEPAALRALEIMLHEAAIALANVELFSQTREAHERLSAIVATVTDRMSIVDRGMRIKWMNEAAAGAVGGDATGQPCFSVMGWGGNTCDTCPAVRTFASGAVHRGVRTFPQPGGGVGYFDVVTAPLRDVSGEVHQVLEVARDITDLMEMEDRLKRSNAALLDAQSQLVESERLAAVGQLVVSLHHSILNPLSGILGALQVARQPDADPEARAQALVEAEREVRVIEQLVRRLGELRRTEGTAYVGGTMMLDLERSGEAGEPPTS